VSPIQRRLVLEWLENPSQNPVADWYEQAVKKTAVVVVLKHRM
jgi:hypothetical protein